MHRTNLGLSLAELMVALVIVGLMTSYSLPYTQRWLERQRMMTLYDDFEASIRFARNAALERSLPVILCPAQEPFESCSTSWQEGWMVFLDAAGDGELSDPSYRLRVHLPPPSGVSINSSTNRVIFHSTGFPNIPSSGLQWSVYTEHCQHEEAQLWFLAITAHLHITAIGCPI